MTKSTFFVLSLLLVASLPCFAAINYTITFTGSGASTSVGDVIVQNLTRSTSVTVPAGNVLSLTVSTAVEQLSASDETIHVYPNALDGKSTVSFFAKQTGNMQINAFGIDGKKIAGMTANLQTGINLFQLSLPKGSFVIQVLGKGYSYTAKMINQTGANNKPDIAYICFEKQVFYGPQKSKSSALGTTTMAYSTGDQLLYKAISGNYSTIVTDVPTASKTTNFNFVACTDADGNNYTTVTIGTQTWIAENLKTTKYNDGTAIPLVTDNTAWAALSTPAFCWQNNNIATLEATYGALYNWFAVNAGKLAPTGWHVATDAELTILENYETANLGTSGSVAKSLAAATNWAVSANAGAIGNDLTKNNSSGFSAFPGGSRDGNNGKFDTLGIYGSWWSASEYNTSYAILRLLYSIDGSILRNASNKTSGFSVRCIKD